MFRNIFNIKWTTFLFGTQRIGDWDWRSFGGFNFRHGRPFHLIPLLSYHEYMSKLLTVPRPSKFDLAEVSRLLFHSPIDNRILRLVSIRSIYGSKQASIVLGKRILRADRRRDCKSGLS